MKSKVNILLSAYNGMEYIEEQMESLLAQTYENIHIYVRDDGSTDSTWDVLSKWENNEKVTLISGENKGFCPSFFALLQQAEHGDYWAFCDQDDIWLPNKIKTAVEWLDQNDSTKIPILFHSSFEFINDKKESMGYYRLPDMEYTFARSLSSNVFFGFSMVINRKLREMLLKGSYQGIKLHDWYAAMIVAAFGKYYHDNEICAQHRIHQNNSTPTSILKKIPLGLELLKGDNYYRQNAKRFDRDFGENLDADNKKVLDLFIGKNQFSKRVKKFFYPHRWNHLWSVEIVFRGLILLGKI